jgi:hypothetical protein
MESTRYPCQRCNYRYNKNEMIFVREAWYCDDLCEDFHEGWICKDCKNDRDTIIEPVEDRYLIKIYY